MCTQFNTYLKLENELENKWIVYYLGLAWAAELGNGVIQTITGIEVC